LQYRDFSFSDCRFLLENGLHDARKACGAIPARIGKNPLEALQSDWNGLFSIQLARTLYKATACAMLALLQPWTPSAGAGRSLQIATVFMIGAPLGRFPCRTGFVSPVPIA
jgi:hypothetical protein